jgi:hypothetical protein
MNMEIGLVILEGITLAVVVWCARRVFDSPLVCGVE